MSSSMDYKETQSRLDMTTNRVSPKGETLITFTESILSNGVVTVPVCNDKIPTKFSQQKRIHTKIWSSKWNEIKIKPRYACCNYHDNSRSKSSCHCWDE